MATNSQATLDKTTDLTSPHKILRDRRSHRNIIFHAGKPNSGKTYSAVQEFVKCEIGIYCCPLRLLAQEIAQKTNNQRIDCDMITGEEKILARPPYKSNHVACTVQVVNLKTEYDVAIIDEIQMLTNIQAGWAFSRAFIGIKAKTLHLCGDMSAFEVIKILARKCGDTVELKEYYPSNKIVPLDEYLGNWSQLMNGDCIVSFSKVNIKKIVKQLRNIGVSTSVIYGSLPPEVKIDQIKKFNAGRSKVLVTTDAIGMGLNAEIRRVIFYELEKWTKDDNGNMHTRCLTTLELSQISGRAARRNTKYADSNGYVMTMYSNGISTLFNIFNEDVPDINKVGLRPPGRMIESFGQKMRQIYPEISFEQIIDRYLKRVQVDQSLYFLCNMKDIKVLANKLGHIRLKIKDIFHFCCAPIALQSNFQVNIFVEMIELYSTDTEVTSDWVKWKIGWRNINQMSRISSERELNESEDIYNALSLYNWMNNKSKDLFPDTEGIRQMKETIAKRIADGINRIHLLKCD